MVIICQQELKFGYEDLVDEGHVNPKGAFKITDCLSDYLEVNYDISAISK